jgi:sulfur carrier protein
MTTVWLNGERREVDEGATVAEVVAAWAVPERGVAVAVDGEVVPRGAWPTVGLADGARLEVLTAVQGG